MEEYKEYNEEETNELFDDTIIKEDYTIETMKVRKTLRFRTFGAVIATLLFFTLRYLDPNVDFNNVNSPIFLIANFFVLLLGAIIYFYDNSVRTIQYKQDTTFRSYKLFNNVMEIAVVVSYLSLTITVINMFFFSLSPITGTSMMPNYSDDDAVIFSHINDGYERYDVVIVHQNSDTTPYLIKRVVGLPGETVSIDNNRIFINDVLLIEEYINSEQVKTYCTNRNIGTYTDQDHCSFEVGVNEYFVLGDNRDGNAVSNAGTSIDSRYFGPVDVNDIYGKVVLKFKDYNIIK